MAEIGYFYKGLYFEYGDFTPKIEETQGIYCLSSNTVMLCLAYLKHYGKWKGRYTYDLSQQNKPQLTDDEYDEIFTIVDLAIKELMADCNLDRMSHSLTEIEFTLKHLLTKLTDETEIKFFIDKPAEPPKLEDGTWDLTVNNAITSPGMSVFMVGSLLENNSITDVLKIATLDDGTIQLPDINPFNLESKLDQIRADITEAKDTHYWFAKAFYGGPFADLYPFGEQTFFARFSGTFNKEIPLTGYISESFYTLASKLNVNIVTSFNETNTDGVASNSYFRYLHIWLNSDWKLFHDVMETMRDCICEAKDWIEQINIALWGDDSTPQLQFIKNSIDNATTAIEGLTLSTTVNVSPTPINNTVNVDACCDGLVDATKDIANNGKDLVDVIKELVEATKDNGSTTVDNGDGTYTTTPITDITYPPLDPDNPELGTTTPYKAVSIKKTNGKNALCGFSYYYLNGLADFIEELLSWLDLSAYLYGIMSTNNATKQIIAKLGSYAIGGIILNKIPLGSLTGLITGYAALQVAIDTLPYLMRNLAEEHACGINGKSPISTRGQFLDVVFGLTVVGLQAEVVNWAAYAAGLFWDYSGADDASVAIIDMRPYKQYCPCPIVGEWEGLWSMGDVNAGIVIEIDMIDEFHWEAEREHWGGGNRYKSTVVGTVDVDNPLLASGTVHEYFHEGFPFHDATYTLYYQLKSSNTILQEADKDLTK